MTAFPTRRLMMSSGSLSTAIDYGHGLLTNNERHFERIEGLNVDNWFK